MATKATTIKLGDLANAIEQAVSANAGRKLPGGIIMGKVVRPDAKIDVNVAARSITKEVAKSAPGVKLTPKVIIDGGFTTMGFIIMPQELLKK